MTRVVWLPGGRGMLALALKRRFEQLGIPFHATDLDVDITDSARVLEFARQERPTHIVNAAAYTRVDDAEANLEAATRVNGDGPANLARAAAELDATLVHFSTDYVFDGRASSPYPEEAPTAPQGAYGKSKLVGEQRIAEQLGAGRGRAYVIRTSWLYGEGGVNFVKTMVGLMRDREELRVVADQRGRPTYTVDLAEAAVQLAGLSEGARGDPGLYHFANSGETTWHGFACAILEQARALGVPLKAQRIVPVTTAEFPRPAPRPLYSVLATERIERALGQAPRPWERALSDYLLREYSPSRNPA